MEVKGQHSLEVREEVLHLVTGTDTFFLSCPFSNKEVPGLVQLLAYGKASWFFGGTRLEPVKRGLWHQVYFGQFKQSLCH